MTVGNLLGKNTLLIPPTELLFFRSVSSIFFFFQLAVLSSKIRFFLKISSFENLSLFETNFQVDLLVCVSQNTLLIVVFQNKFGICYIIILLRIDFLSILHSQPKHWYFTHTPGKLAHHTTDLAFSLSHSTFLWHSKGGSHGSYRCHSRFSCHTVPLVLAFCTETLQVSLGKRELMLNTTLSACLLNVVQTYQNAN